LQVEADFLVTNLWSFQKVITCLNHVFLHASTLHLAQRK
jgi:hypothetical protein